MDKYMDGEMEEGMDEWMNGQAGESAISGRCTE